MRFSYLTILLLVSNPLLAVDWPHWLGPNRNGYTAEVSGWDGKNWLGDRPTWKGMAFEGSNSPIVVGEQVFLFGHREGKEIVQCLKLSDGKTIWSETVKGKKYGRFREGDEGFYAGPSGTPEYDPGTKYLYTLGNDGDLTCLDSGAQGKLIWQKNLYDEYGVGKRPKLTRAPQRDYGCTSSPLVLGDWLVVEVGSTKQGTVMAFDKKTGKEVWKSEHKDEAGHTGGLAKMKVEGVDCLVVLTQRNLLVLRVDPGQEGKTVATFPWVTDFANSIAGPAVKDDSVILATHYNHSTMIRLKVTLKGATEVWRAKFPSKVCTPVIDGDAIYLAWQKLRCIDFKTGQLTWEGATVGDPGSCVVTKDRKLIGYGQKGKLVLVDLAGEGGKKYVELSAQDMGWKVEAWPHVVLANGYLLAKDRLGNLNAYRVGSGK